MRAGVDGVIGMHGGLPPADVFPLQAATFTFHQPPDAGTDTADDAEAMREGDSGVSSAMLDQSTVEHRIADAATLATLQQYPLDFNGYAPVRKWVSQLVQSMQQPVRTDWGILIANGAIHSLEMIFRSLLNPGDSILVEEFTFSQVLDGLLQPIGLQPCAVAMDSEGASCGNACCPWQQRLCHLNGVL